MSNTEKIKQESELPTIEALSYTAEDLQKWGWWAEKEGVDTEDLKKRSDNLIAYVAKMAFWIMGNRFQKVFKEYEIYPDCSAIDSGWEPDCAEDELRQFAIQLQDTAV